MSNTPCRALRETETVISVHSLAEVKLEKPVNRMNNRGYIFESLDQGGCGDF